MSIKNQCPPSHFARAKGPCSHFQIASSALWLWVKTRPGFPQPLGAYVLASIAGTLAPSMGWLIVWRTMQGAVTLVLLKSTSGRNRLELRNDKPA